MARKFLTNIAFSAAAPLGRVTSVTFDEIDPSDLPAGAAGSVWYDGSGVPSSGLGVNGDYYLDTATGNVYAKAAGDWGLVGNIKGADGAPGADGTDGTDGTNGAPGATGATGAPGSVWRDAATVPSNSLGVDGDYYLHDLTADVYHKVSGAYAVVANIRGSSGTDGSAGAPGTNDRNLVDNGNFNLWQRGTSFAALASGSYAADRFFWFNNTAAVATISQSTDVPTFAQSGVLSTNSLKTQVTTVDASIAAGDLCVLQHRIEGYDFRYIAQQYFSLSFWVKAFKTGVYTLALNNASPADRSYVNEYTINASGTWEYKTMTFYPSPAAGTWNYYNGTGLAISWVLAAGATYQTGTTGGWLTGNVLSTANQVNGLDSTSNYFFLSQIQVNVGFTQLPLQHRSYAEELVKCQRYYEKEYEMAQTVPTNIGGGAIGHGNVMSPGSFSIMIQPYKFRVRKRAAPTVVIYDRAGNANKVSVWSSSNVVTDNNAIATLTAYETGGYVRHDPGSATGAGMQFVYSASADL